MLLNVAMKIMSNSGYKPDRIFDDKKNKEKTIYYFHPVIMDTRGTHRGYALIQTEVGGELIFQTFDRVTDELETWESNNLSTLRNDLNKIIKFLKKEPNYIMGFDIGKNKDYSEMIKNPFIKEGVEFIQMYQALDLPLVHNPNVVIFECPTCRKPFSEPAENCSNPFHITKGEQ